MSQDGNVVCTEYFKYQLHLRMQNDLTPERKFFLVIVVAIPLGWLDRSRTVNRVTRG